MIALNYLQVTKACLEMKLFRSCYSTGTVSGKVIRQSFIDYFVQDHDHTFVRSSPVVPFCDPTVPFVNAGMNQFKGILLGNVQAPYKRAANSQKCVRVGGKHNDLDVVGTDGYHHTFFEMLGSWSFGDYFKKEACELAWQLLTQHYGLSPSRLYVTYFGGDRSLGLQPDFETQDIWQKIGVPSDHILPFGSDENFWEMGATGPCGPCTEIHVDHIADRIHAADIVNKGYDHLTELWNLVFIQYNRTPDRILKELPCHHVDTGMGLERLVAILQGKRSNYDTDLFQALFEAIHKNSKGVQKYQGKFMEDDVKGVDTGYRILADHARMITVALADGMFPDQNYKLRRVMRKAMLVSEQTFGVEKGLLRELTNYVAESFHEVYPEVGCNLKRIQLIIQNEEELLTSLRKDAAKNWHKILLENPKLGNLDVVEMPGLVAGYHELKAYTREQTEKYKNCDNITYSVARCESSVLPSYLTFKLYDTYGLEEHVILQLAETEGFKLDIEGFRNSLSEAKARSRGSVQYKLQSEELQESLNQLVSNGVSPTDDSMKYKYTVEGNKCVFPQINCEVKGIILNGKLVPEVEQNVNCSIILDKTNFYCEAGGQVSDKGLFIMKNGTRFHVTDVSSSKGYILHHGSVINGSKMTIGDDVSAEVDGEYRIGNMRNHTATHLVNAALHKILTVTCQKSSHVTNPYFIFDFSVYNELFTTEHLELLEDLVQRCVKANVSVNRFTITPEKLIAMNNVLLIPGEVYPDKDIHIIEIDSGDILKSREACCGTHVLKTAEIKDFCVVSLKTAGSGTRSLKAVTGEYAESARHAAQQVTSEVADLETQVDCFLRSEKNVQQVELLDARLQDLKQNLSRGSKIIPYLVNCQLLEKLDDLNKKLKDNARGILRDSLEAEMQGLLSNKEKPLYLVHFLKCSSTMDSIPLQKATRMCSHIPVLLIAQSEGVLKARCCVPKELVSERFNAELWMKTVLEVLRSKGTAPKGQDPLLVYNMKGKKIPADSLNRLISLAVENASQYAEHHLASHTPCAVSSHSSK